MKMRSRHLVVVFLLGSVSLAVGEASPSTEEIKFFETKVRPLLAAKCYGCHGEEKTKGGLRADHIDALLEGGDSGPALVRKDPQNSLLIEAVRRTDPDFAMPPKEADALSDAEIADLEKWITMGAPWPKDESFTAVERDEHGFSAEDRAWWAVQPVTEPAVPVESGQGWARNEIDHFIHRKLEENHLAPAPEASPLELVRRLYFDLHGLPPLPEQIDAFVAAYGKDPESAMTSLVDELLASPRYGERWGQYWLDVVRYAESDGYNQDAYRPGAKAYRNYVIDSFNEDKSYAQFVREQLAGDLLDPDNPDVMIGTSFLRQGVYEYNQHNVRMHWDIIMTDMTNVTAEAFLGISIGCAQCHDHKFDPILQKDFFALQAFLSTTAWPSDIPLATAEEKAEFGRKQQAWEEATAGIRAELAELEAETLNARRAKEVAMYPADIQAMVHKAPEDRGPFEVQMVTLVDRFFEFVKARIDYKKAFEKTPEKLKQWETLKKQLAEFDELKPAPLPEGFVATDISATPVTPVIKKRDKEIPVEPAFLTLLDQPAPSIHPTENNTGRRLALADWIASSDNPLSTRVITNRIWQGHFGTGLVATPNDFGNLGGAPSHPELLDWLTTRFLENGWKRKDIHRLILTSSTYRMSARKEPGPVEAKTDPENRLLWRFPPRRLTSEEVRDAMLVASGEIRFPKSDSPDSVSGTSPDRSIYVKKLRNKPDPLLGSFDAPAGFQSTPSRPETTTPTQSLLLINNEWPLDRARAFAKSLPVGKSEERTELVVAAYRRAFGREPNEQEIDKALGLIDSLNRVRSTTQQGQVDEPTGFGPNSKSFAAVQGVDIGTHALRLQRDSRFEQFEADLPFAKNDDAFTVEAVTQLDTIYADGTVNTLVSRWDNNRSTNGWFLCVTSTKSRYQPRNILFVMNGIDHKGQPKYEVVAADLRVPLEKPFYIAASVTARPRSKGSQQGEVTFFLKDLSDPKAEMQTVTVPHTVVGKINDSDFPVLVGGRGKMGHVWDGEITRLTISQGGLPEKRLILQPQADAPKRIVDWKFSENPMATAPAPNARWYGRESSDPLLDSVADFCHLLFNSNEFLYLY